MTSSACCSSAMAVSCVECGLSGFSRWSFVDALLALDCRRRRFVLLTLYPSGGVGEVTINVGVASLKVKSDCGGDTDSVRMFSTCVWGSMAALFLSFVCFSVGVPIGRLTLSTLGEASRVSGGLRRGLKGNGFVASDVE